ncbi:MarR family transcriptional regulator [Streptomyces sp. NPDC051555]|uniref:MarR family transcriptional regulator n=1 Tax=Streptomyces sp. NPDC051555 TaxID=3365657 RepID=UPI0037A6CB3B
MMTAQAMEQPWLSPRDLNDMLMRAVDLQGADLRVLMYYATAVPAGEAVPQSVRAIGERLGLSSTASSRSVKKLVEARWLTVAYAAVGLKFYRLGPMARAAAAEPSDELSEGALASVHHLPIPERE